MKQELPQEEQLPKLQEEQPKKPFWQRYKKPIIALLIVIAAANLFSFLKNASVKTSLPSELTGMPARPEQSVGTPSDRAPAPLTRVEVANAAALKEALRSKGNLEILLTADIDEHDNSDAEVWCAVANGYKCLDLNGHSVVVRNDWVRSSVLMEVGVGAELVIWDSRGAGGKISYDGYIDEEATLRSRDLFEVYGRLVVNGGRLEAGRVTDSYNETLNRRTQKQITGSAVRVRENGILTVNGGCLIGRGLGECAMLAEEGGSVIFNNGTACGYGQAQCVEGEAYAASGRFTVGAAGQYQQDGAQSFTPEYAPCIGLREDQIAEHALFDGPVGADTTELSIAVGAGRCELSAESGDAAQTEDGGQLLRIMSEMPFISVIPEEPYFREVDETDYPGVDYKIRYRWQVLHAGRVISETEDREDLTRINLMSAFSGFTPALGEPYTVRCKMTEQLKPGLVYERCCVDTPFVLVQSVRAPFLINDLWQTSYFRSGSDLTISIGAAGTKLNYQWQELLPGGAWTELPEQTAPGLALEALTEADVGRRFRCRVYNTEGELFSSETELALLQGEIEHLSFTGIDPPVHGELPDDTAEVLTPGCAVVEVSWKPLGKSAAEQGFRPYAGMKMVVSITVRRDRGTAYAEKLSADLDGLEWMTISAKDDPNCTVEFCLTTAPPQEPEKIDLIRLACTEPESGAVCGSVSAVNMGYDDGTAADLRYTALGNTEWSEDGEPMRLMKDSFETDRVYTVNANLLPNEGWTFTDATIAELNGEQMDAQLLANGTLSCSYRYDLTREDGDEQAELFVDVTEDDFFYEAVIWAVGHDPQVTTGTDSRHFSPKANCTRAQVITFLWRALCCPQPESPDDFFRDVRQESYYDQAIRWAMENNVTVGTTEETFNPANDCTRGEFVTFLWRALGMPESGIREVPFTDLSPDGYYCSAVCWALENDITMGSGGDRFQPDEFCTRGQVVTFLYRAMKGQPELTGQPEDMTVPPGKGVVLRMEFEGGRGVCECSWEEYTPRGVWVTRASTQTAGSSARWSFGPGRTAVLRPVVRDGGGLRVVGRPFAVAVAGKPTAWTQPLRLLSDLPEDGVSLPEDGEALTLRCLADGGSACYDYRWYRVEDDGSTQRELGEHIPGSGESYSSYNCAYITQPGTYLCSIRDRLTGQTLTTRELSVRGRKK